MNMMLSNINNENDGNSIENNIMEEEKNQTIEKNN
jgi:hypothetical protein